MEQNTTARTRMTPAEKVAVHAARLAASPMAPQEGSRFAPAHRVETGLYLSGDGSLLIAKQADGWRVSHFQVAEGEIQVVGEVAVYPTAQQALAALR